MTVPIIVPGPQGTSHHHTALVTSGVTNPASIVSNIDAGTLINTPGKRLHGQSRPPIREQEVIDQLNPLIQKDDKTIDDLKQESE